jgi:hypothetical protein
MDDGRPTEVPPLGDADVWEDDDFTRALCEEAPRTYGAGLFSVISLSILLVMGVDASDLRKLVEPPSAAEQTVAKGLVEAAFTCINNEDVNFCLSINVIRYEYRGKPATSCADLPLPCLFASQLY